MTRKKTFLALSFVLIILAIAGGIFFLSDNKEEKAEEPKPFGHEALKINGTFVSSDIFISERNDFFQKHKRNPDMMRKTDEERNDMLLDQIIEKVILDDYAFEKSGITVTEEEIDAYISRFIDAKYENPAERNQFMLSQGYQNEEEMRQGIKEYITKHQLFYNAALKYSVPVDQKEFEEKYNEHKMQNKKVDYRHIFISKEDIGKEKAYENAKGIYESLLEGEDFEELAKKHSDDKETAENGGLVTGAVFAKTHPEINRQIFSAEVHQLLEPIETLNGYEIIYIENIVEYFRTEEEYREMFIVNAFLNSEEYKEWIEELKKEYEIEILDPEMKAYRLYREENYQEAAIMYEELYKDSGNDFYIVRALDSYTLAENWTGLIRVCEEALKKGPKNVMNYLNCAVGYYYANNEKKALELLKKAEKLSGENLYWQTMVKETYERLGLTEHMENK